MNGPEDVAYVVEEAVGGDDSAQGENGEVYILEGGEVEAVIEEE